MSFARPPKSHWMSYRIARGEQGVLIYEPYKSYLLPLWRFCTVPIARNSSAALWAKFLEFFADDDFVGMDMARKFIQMGMTRSKRYANYKGGRKYVDGKEKGNAMEKSKGHEGKAEKEEASRIFKQVWEKCKEHEGYARLKAEFLAEQKDWSREHIKGREDKEEMKPKTSTSQTKIKVEEDNEMTTSRASRSRTKIKTEDD